MAVRAKQLAILPVGSSIVDSLVCCILRNERAVAVEREWDSLVNFAMQESGTAHQQMLALHCYTIPQIQSTPMQ